MKFQNFRKFWMKIQKSDIFFNQMLLKLSHHASKTKKNFLVVYLFLTPLLLLQKKQKMNFEEDSYSSNVIKNVKKIQIFGKNFSVEKSKKKFKKKKKIF